MKTKLVRPLLVKSKEYVDKYPFLGIDNGKLSIYSERNPSNFNVVIYQLILISLDPEEKIEVGDEVFANGVDYFGTETQLCTLSEFINKDGIKKIGINHAIKVYKSGYHKVIATQDQLSPEHIQQLVDEYNNEGMQDFEIEMQEDKSNLCDCYYTKFCKSTQLTPGVKCRDIKHYILKLTNGFVTVVNKLLMSTETNSDAFDKGFVIGENSVRERLEAVLYSEEEVKALINKAIFDTVGNPMLITSELEINDKWFTKNKKK